MLQQMVGRTEEQDSCCGAKGCMCGMLPNEIDPNICHGCDGFGWVPVDGWARLCPVCEGSGEYSPLPKIEQPKIEQPKIDWGRSNTGTYTTWV